MSEIVTLDRKMQDLIQLSKTIAKSKATVLIQGESGTGKELMASLIHQNSSRANKPFIAINCAAIPENLLESELFGYERGAFTGAVNSKAGKFELANGGTILLDEISEMDARLQAKLLRVIQEGEVDRVGGRRTLPVDVRIIATTNRNLSHLIKEGTFREDLFYRLNVVNLTLPALRDRIGDVRKLAGFFFEKYTEKNFKPATGIADDAMGMLEMHKWPGNVRELEHVIERAVLTMEGGMLRARDISIVKSQQNLSDLGRDFKENNENDYSEEGSGWAPGRTLDDIERNVIIEALKYHSGNRTHTARALGISIRTLRNKIADYRRIGIYV